MDEALLLIQAYQTWIYAVLALAFVLYARSAIFWWRLYDRSEFGLERERARRRITRAGVMGVWVVLVAGMTFLAATVLSPAVPAALRPTPLPTVSLLATPSTPAPLEAGPAARALHAARHLDPRFPSGIPFGMRSAMRSAMRGGDQENAAPARR